jgi:hypothetical protein
MFSKQRKTVYVGYGHGSMEKFFEMTRDYYY